MSLRRLAICLLPFLLGGTLAMSAGHERFRLVGRATDAAAEWLDTDGERTLFGSGHRMRLVSNAATSPEVLLETILDRPVTGGVLFGERLFLVEQERRLLLLDLADPAHDTTPVELEPAPMGRLQLARMGGLLLVAEDGFGVRLIDAPMPHDHPGGHHAPPAPHEVGRFELPTRFDAIAGVTARFYLAFEGQVAEIDARDRNRPSLGRRIHGTGPLRALAASGTKLYRLGPDGLSALDLSDADSGPKPVPQPLPSGRALATSGRLLHIAVGEEGVVQWRDETQGPLLHEVNLGNNFFSPAALTIDVNDFVRWSNTVGFHNVFSCNPGQTGCAGQNASETFTSGPGANPPWTYTYQFQLAGSNPYVCQPHSTRMQGLVTVNASAPLPPVVPDGGGGTPMLVSKLDPAAATLSIAWDTASCPDAVDHHILFGLGSRLPLFPGGLYFLQGGECSLGLISPHVWNGVPDPSSDATNMLWYLVLANDGVDTEGSWGEDSTGNERSTFGATGASNRCGMTTKDLGNTCGAD